MLIAKEQKQLEIESLKLRRVGVYKTYSARILGTFQPETRVVGYDLYLNAPACDTTSRQEVMGDDIFHQHTNATSYEPVNNQNWQRLSPGHRIGQGGVVHLLDCWNYYSTAKKLFGTEDILSGEEWKALSAKRLILVKLEPFSNRPLSGSLLNPENGVVVSFSKGKLQAAEVEV